MRQRGPAAWVVGVLAALAGCMGGGDRSGYRSDVPHVPTPWPPDPPQEPYVPPVPPVVESERPPAPLSGGTLLLTRDGRWAWAASPDGDLVWKVDLGSATVAARIALSRGDEPGRLVEDGDGRIHVALRRGGAIATIDPSGTVEPVRRAVCAEPRGITWDEDGDVVHVACASGDLVTLPASGGEPTRRWDLGPDLRDVLVLPDGSLAVTRFRHAVLEHLDAEGRVTRARTPATYDPFLLEPDFQGQFVFAPTTAWRTVVLPGGDGVVAMVHQRARITNVDTQVGGYSGDGCDGGIVHTAVTLLGANEEPAKPILAATLPVDVAVSHDGRRIAVAAAGAGGVYELRTDVAALVERGPCLDQASAGYVSPLQAGRAVAVAYTLDDRLVTQFRDPAHIEIVGRPVIPLEDDEHPHTGFDLFHFTSPALTCASCHPEGREDGHTWLLGGDLRRTQTTAGGILGTAPFHWSGDMAKLEALSVAVFDRMSIAPPPPEHLASMSRWVQSIPRVEARPADASQVARGRGIFESAEAGCADCHGGAHLTTNQYAHVGTDGAFQIPSLLGVAQRAPFLHDGRAATLLEAFDAGGTGHGNTSDLDREELDALVAYLQSL